MCYEQNFDLSHSIFQLLAKQQVPAWTTNKCSAYFIQEKIPSDKSENVSPPFLFPTQNYELIYGAISDLLGMVQIAEHQT